LPPGNTGAGAVAALFSIMVFAISSLPVDLRNAFGQPNMKDGITRASTLYSICKPLAPNALRALRWRMPHHRIVMIMAEYQLGLVHSPTMFELG
jgi:hypothetical protein